MALLDLGKWEGAYDLAGYAIELALKACIIKLVMATDAFLEKEFSRQCYTHSLEELLKLAGLDTVLDAARRADPILRNNWGVAKDWTEAKRFHRIPEIEAKALYAAIADPSHGVFPLIKTHWSMISLNVANS